MASGIEKTIDSAKLSFCKAITKNKYKQLKQCKSLNQIGELALNTGMAQSVQKYNVLGSSRKLGDLFSKNKSPKKVAA